MSLNTSMLAAGDNHGDPVQPTTPGGPAPTRRRYAPRRPRDLDTIDYALGFACVLSAVAACWLIFAKFTGGTGWFGFLLASYGVFLGLFFVVTHERHGHLVAVDRTVTVAICTAAVLVLVPLLWLVIDIVAKGLPNFRFSFFFHDQRGVSPLSPATAGGGLHAFVGTVEQVGMALALSAPLGIVTAVFLNETKSDWRRPVRTFVDAMTGLPEVIAGLFIYALLILPFAKDTTLFDFNGFLAALALSLVMMPTICRTVEVVLRLVPDGLREAGYAMGASQARVVVSVVLPTARSGIATAVVLGVARTVGETAPLLFTSFGNTLMNANPFSGPQESLPLYIYRYIREPNTNDINRGYTAAFVLMVLVLALFVVARYLGRDRTRARRRGPLKLLIATAGHGARSLGRIDLAGRVSSRAARLSAGAVASLPAFRPRPSTDEHPSGAAGKESA